VSILADVMRHRMLRRCSGCSFPCDGFVVIATPSAPNQRAGPPCWGAGTTSCRLRHVPQRGLVTRAAPPTP